jgi:hypothetical protein
MESLSFHSFRTYEYLKKKPNGKYSYREKSFSEISKILNEGVNQKKAKVSQTENLNSPTNYCD